MIEARTKMSDREREEFEQEKTMALLSSDHNLRLKEMELEIAQIEAKWTNILRLPLLIVKLPLLVLLGFAYIVAVLRKYEPSEDFWKLLR